MTKTLILVLFGVGVLNVVDACLSTQFTCDSGQCILSSYRCDGDNDCTDSSDERNCFGCPSGYPCKNGQCTIFLSDRCDGFRDCRDGSDESNCPGTSTTGIIVGAVIGAIFFTVIIPVGICVTVLCCVFCCAGTMISSHSRRSHNIRTNVVPATVPIVTTTTTTVEAEEPAYPVDSKLQQEPPPSYYDANNFPQQQPGTYPSQRVGAYQPPDTAYPPQQEVPGAYPPDPNTAYPPPVGAYPTAPYPTDPSAAYPPTK